MHEPVRKQARLAANFAMELYEGDMPSAKTTGAGTSLS